MHHGTPWQILEKLPAEVRKACQGKRGMPNRIRVPESQHIAAHANGYNARFMEEIEKAGGYLKVEAEHVWEIRRNLLKEFGLRG